MGSWIKKFVCDSRAVIGKTSNLHAVNAYIASLHSTPVSRAWKRPKYSNIDHYNTSLTNSFPKKYSLNWPI